MYLTTKDVANYLRVHVLTIYKLANSKKIPSIKIGKVRRFKKEVIDKWLENKMERKT